MLPEDALSRRFWADRWLRLAIAAWAVLLAVVCVRAAWSPRRNSVSPIFAHAARAWWAGDDLYFITIDQKVGDLDHYRYAPGVAALLTPLAFLPDSVGGVLWRCLNAAVFLGAAAWWARRVLPMPLTPARTAALLLLMLPPAVGSLNNGQSNPLVIGLVLAAVAGCATDRWNLATVCLTVACLLKIYPIAIGLLLCLVYPRPLTLRLLVALPLGFALPFLLQRPDYVLAQYRDWLALLQTDDRTWWPLESSYRDAWMLCRLARLPLSHTGYVAVQLLAAATVAGLCLAARWRHGPGREALTTLTVLGTGWMTLFGPATESCTYVLLAPALAWEVVRGWGASPREAAGPFAAYLLLLSSYVALWFPGGRAWVAMGPQPLAALVLFAWSLAGVVRPGRAVPLHGTAS